MNVIFFVEELSMVIISYSPSFEFFVNAYSFPFILTTVSYDLYLAIFIMTLLTLSPTTNSKLETAFDVPSFRTELPTLSLALTYTFEKFVNVNVYPFEVNDELDSLSSLPSECFASPLSPNSNFAREFPAGWLDSDVSVVVSCVSSVSIFSVYSGVFSAVVSVVAAVSVVSDSPVVSLFSVFSAVTDSAVFSLSVVTEFDVVSD